MPFTFKKWEASFWQSDNEFKGRMTWYVVFVAAKQKANAYKFKLKIVKNAIFFGVKQIVRNPHKDALVREIHEELQNPKPLIICEPSQFQLIQKEMNRQN